MLASIYTFSVEHSEKPLNKYVIGAAANTANAAGQVVAPKESLDIAADVDPGPAICRFNASRASGF